MSEQETALTPPASQPSAVPEAYNSWNDYWTKEHNQPWRTEPEIDEDRQHYLAIRREILSDIEADVFPFCDEVGSVKRSIKLTRSDVEWMLATHESKGEVGPVLWALERFKPPNQWREGLDLHGADLDGVDLTKLPLARVRAGTSAIVRARADLNRVLDTGFNNVSQPFAGTTYLIASNLSGAQLQQARLNRAVLVGANLKGADLTLSDLREADLQGAYCIGTVFTNAVLLGTNLRGAYFDDTTKFEDTTFGYASSALYKDGYFRTKFKFLKFRTREYHGMLLFESSFRRAGREGLNIFPLLADARWRDVNVSGVDWSGLWVLGDEFEARMSRTIDGRKKNKFTRLTEYSTSVRAYRQLAAVLRNQGLHEEANRFSYRAQLLQRRVLWRQSKPWATFGSWFLDLISGYGYKPMRSVFTYIIVILGFATAYFALTNFGITQFLPSHPSPLPWYEALVLSVSSFHGRGLFPTGLSLGDPIAILAAFEAIIGLLIEITFIATFTQRFFAR